MSDNEIQVAEAEETDALPVIDELTVLKDRARLMGIKHSNNISLAGLKAKIQAALNDEKDSTDADGNETAPATVEAVSLVQSEAPKPVEQPNTPKKTLRQQLVEEQMKLVRLRITNLDPKKKDLPGEILTVANEYLGTVRKFVPFGSATDNGFHVPFCLYTMMKEREFLSITTRKGKNGTPIVETRMAREFALDVLPPLTQKELADLAAAQAAGHNID